MIKKILIVITLIILLFVNSANAICTDCGGNNPPWGGPMGPWCELCYNESSDTWQWEGYNDYLSNPVPDNFERDVEITAKGIQTCINLTLPPGCLADITFQWLNTTLYYNDWIDWRDLQDWIGWEVNWSTEPTWENDSYWFNYSNWTALSVSQQLCEYNTNWSCRTENDWASGWDEWRIIANITCGTSTFNITCYYCFQPELCPVSYIYPPSPNGTACPCCDSYCITIDNELGHPMNATVYGSHYPDIGFYQISDGSFEYVSNGTYCFCMCEYDFPHIVGHSHTQQNVTAINTWYNISFGHPHIFGFLGDGTNATILYSGMYTLRYWASVQDASPNPLGNRMAIAIFCNGDEIDGSYREVEFSIQHGELHMAGEIHDYYPAWENISFRYIGDDTDQAIRTNGTWSGDDISVYGAIMKEDSMVMEYNKTYYWYVNLTDAVTGESTDSAIFQFRTAESPELCFCGNFSDAFADASCGCSDSAGIIGLIGIVGLIGWFMVRKRLLIKKEKK